MQTRLQQRTKKRRTEYVRLLTADTLQVALGSRTPRARVSSTPLAKRVAA